MSIDHIEVRHLEGDRFRIRIRGHQFVVDQPFEDGGSDAGPTPTELFAASLAACVAFYAGRFLRRHDLATEGLNVRCGFGMADGHPARITAVELAVDLPAGFPESRRQALHRVVEHCTLQNTLREPPEVRILVGQPGEDGRGTVTRAASPCGDVGSRTTSPSSARAS